MLSNRRNDALAAIRHAESATISVGRANAAHCAISAQHQGLGTDRAAFGGREDLPLAELPSGKPPKTADPGTRGLAACNRKSKRGQTLTAMRGTNEVPAAVWAALVLGRTMCS